MYLSASPLTDFDINQRKLIKTTVATAPALLYKVAIAEAGTLTLKSSTPTGATGFDVGYMIFNEVGTEVARGTGINVLKTLAVTKGNYVIKLSNPNGVGSDSNILGVSNFNIEISLATATNQTPEIFDIALQQQADKDAIAVLKNKIKTGIGLADDDVVFYMLGDSILATNVMKALDAGGSFAELKALGLTDTQALDVLSVYNIKMSADRYEIELAIGNIDTNKTLVVSFLSYLQKNNLSYPDLSSLFASIRSTPALSDAARTWNKTRTV